MTVYKRSTLKMIKSILIAPLPSIAVGFVMMFLLQYFPFTWLYVLMIAAVVLIFAWMLYNAIIGENISFELSPDGTLNCLKGKKNMGSFDLNQCALRYHHVKYTNGGTQKLFLYIEKPDGNEESFDCEPLGESKFLEMYQQMQRFGQAEPERL